MFVYGTYVLKGEVDVKFFLDDIWKLFQEDTLPNDASNFCRQIINCMKASSYLKNIRSSTGHRDYQASTWVNDGGWKNVLVGEYKRSPAFSVYKVFAQGSHIEDTWKTQFLGFMGPKNMIQLWPLQICLETLLIPIHLKMETEEFVSWFWLMFWCRWNIA